ncbi:MAG TPA: hypothetical protein VFL91_01840, partial [Thermomicrobiales bacterium]|nr:hypothetical protein [Thermomicrobiales bacterium]
PDLDGYLAALDAEARRQDDPALAALALEQVDFIRGLARRHTLLTRRFYVVVPADDEAAGAPLLGALRHRRAGGEGAATRARRQLSFRCVELARQFGRCGLGARRLRTAELLELHYACWCPELARSQRLRRDIADYTALVVTGARPARRSATVSGDRRV